MAFNFIPKLSFWGAMGHGRRVCTVETEEHMRHASFGHDKCPPVLDEPLTVRHRGDARGVQRGDHDVNYGLLFREHPPHLVNRHPTAVRDDSRRELNPDEFKDVNHEGCQGGARVRQCYHFT